MNGGEIDQFIEIAVGPRPRPGMGATDFLLPGERRHDVGSAQQFETRQAADEIGDIIIGRLADDFAGVPICTNCGHRA